VSDRTQRPGAASLTDQAFATQSSGAIGKQTLIPPVDSDAQKAVDAGDQSEPAFRHPDWPAWRDRSQNELRIPPVRAKFLWKMIYNGMHGGDKPDVAYAAVANDLFEFMQLKEPGAELALWSGNIALSEHAGSQGKQTLEMQEFYKLTSGISFAQEAAAGNWPTVVRPLWDAFSRRLVQQWTGKSIHVYMCRWWEDSVFLRIERAVMLGLGVKIIYHGCDVQDPPGGGPGVVTELFKTSSMTDAQRRFEQLNATRDPGGRSYYAPSAERRPLP
jgi:hypothetical protein